MLFRSSNWFQKLLEGTVVIQYAQFQDNELYDLVSKIGRASCRERVFNWAQNLLEGTVIIQYAQFQDNELYDLVSTCHSTVRWDTINKGDTRSDERTTHTSVPR